MTNLKLKKQFIEQHFREEDINKLEKYGFIPARESDFCYGYAFTCIAEEYLKKINNQKYISYFSMFERELFSRDQAEDIYFNGKYNKDYLYFSTKLCEQGISSSVSINDAKVVSLRHLKQRPGEHTKSFYEDILDEVFGIGFYDLISEICEYLDSKFLVEETEE